MEFLPSRSGIAAVPPGDVADEILDQDLVSRSVSGDLVEGQTAVLDDHDGLLANEGQCCLDDAVRFAGGLGQNEQLPWRLTDLHAAGAFPTGCVEACAELAAGS